MQKIVWWVLAIVIIGSGWYYYSKNSVSVTTTESTEMPAIEAKDADLSPATLPQAPTGANASPDISVATSPDEGATAATIVYDGSSFTPTAVSIKSGTSVTFTSTAESMWVASAPHPSHTGYDGTTGGQHCAALYSGPAPFDQCGMGTGYTFTFNKPGTWKYHDHKNPSAFGSVTVK